MLNLNVMMSHAHDEKALAAYRQGLSRTPELSPRERYTALQGARRMINRKRLSDTVAREFEQLLS